MRNDRVRKRTYMSGDAKYLDEETGLPMRGEIVKPKGVKRVRAEELAEVTVGADEDLGVRAGVVKEQKQNDEGGVTKRA